MDLFKTMYRITIASAALLLVVVLGLASYTLEAAELNTQLPAGVTSSGSLVPVNIDLPRQPLDASLKQLARSSGISVAFDSKLASGKTAPAVKGRMTANEALKQLLAGSDLEFTLDKDNAIVKPAKPAAQAPDLNMELMAIEVRAKRFHDVGPMPGLGLTKEQIAGNVQSISAKEIKDAQSLSLTDLLNSKLQSVNVNDYQGNPFQMDLTYRGFTAGPQIGTPQGLSVFFDGIRVNEPFGEVVNWDLIPMNAIASMDVFPGSNPLFGLNTLGGAFSIKTKSGFDSPGVSAQILKGSFGRDQLQASAGWNNGSNLAAFGAVNLFMEDGWRENSPSKVNQAFGKLEWQGARSVVGLSMLGAVTKLVGNGTVPLELYKEDKTAVFTSPDETRNRLFQLQLSGAFDLTDTVNLTGMIYHRDSRRTSSTGDIIDADSFRNLGNASRNANPGELVSCVFQDSDRDGFPDYYLETLDQIDPSTGQPTSAFRLDYQQRYALDTSAQPNYSLLGSVNPGGLPAGYLEKALAAINTYDRHGVRGRLDETQPNGEAFVFYGNTAGFFDHMSGGRNYSGDSAYFIQLDGSNNLVRTNIVPAPPINPGCFGVQRNNEKLYLVDSNGNVITQPNRDGAVNSQAAGASGYIPGTPTGVLTKSLIDQSTRGGALQLNWNLDTHKLMLGASLDRASAKYNATQRFALLDNNRNVYADADNIGREYYAGSHDVPINDFEGTSMTKSLYVSETWTPVPTLNLSASARYNATSVKNTLAPRERFFNLSDPNLLNRFLNEMICPGTGTAECPFDPSRQISIDEFRKLINRGFNPLGAPITEKFNFYSLNPALGVTWQTTPRLNLYGNWNQGTRVPSIIELGCAYDDTPTIIRDSQGNPISNGNGGVMTGPRTLVDRRSCSLPSVMSGDPYLPQIKAQTFEIGARGKFKDLLEWNVSAYRTNLRDDIYLVAATSELSYFQNIGDTQRQGLEFGLAGEYGRHDFRMNYSLTQATFQSYFKMLSPNNSSVISTNTNSGNYNTIQVSPGDRMPGVPLSNLNFSWGYKVTPALKVRLSMVAHGESFLRGNENNRHAPGPSRPIISSDENGQPLVIDTPDYRYAGKAAGYAIFNLRATYDLGSGWTAGMMVNNLFNKEYFSAGRLGLSPFAPSINGAIGAGGFNYNSSEWLSTQFMSAGAPRGLWLTLAYDFDTSNKNKLPPASSTVPEPDRTLEFSEPLSTPEEQALQQAISRTKAVPVLTRNGTPSVSDQIAAEQQVSSMVEQWRQAQLANDSTRYLQFYASSFIPDDQGRAEWEQAQKLRLSTGAEQAFSIDNLLIASQGRGMTAVFRLSSSEGKPIRKVLGLEQRDGKWMIVREHTLKAATRPSPQASNTVPPANLRLSLQQEAQ